jgi:hypothetical protein
MIPFLDLKAPHQELREDLEAAFHEVLDSGWFTQGSQLEAFEMEYANLCLTIIEKGAQMKQILNEFWIYPSSP